MKLWLLKANDDNGWDVADGFVVRALTDEHARFLAAQLKGDEGEKVWMSPSHSSCVEIPTDGVPDVILRSFVAG